MRDCLAPEIISVLFVAYYLLVTTCILFIAGSHQDEVLLHICFHADDSCVCWILLGHPTPEGTFLLVDYSCGTFVG